MPPSARLVLMGALELHRSGAPVSLPVSARRLLAFAALHPKPLARIYVAGHLWLDSTEPRAGASLRSALWRLHRAAGDVVWANGRELGLAPWVEVDVQRVAVLARELDATPSPVPPSLVSELIGSDELLPDWYEEWVETERDRFRQVRLHALERLCERLTAEGRFGEALEAGQAALAGEPLRESAHRVMIALHLAEGNVNEAVRQFDTCERLMSRELGVRPSAQLVKLIEDGVAERSGKRRRRDVTSRRRPPARRRSGGGAGAVSRPRGRR